MVEITYVGQAPGDRFLFAMNANWNSRYFGYGVKTLPHEKFLEERGLDWYYGGNRYLVGDRAQYLNQCLVLTGTAAAMAFRLSGLINDAS